ncbi:MAG: DUF362 domain-containing protein [Planctomycetota bacterium]
MKKNNNCSRREFLEKGALIGGLGFFGLPLLTTHLLNGEPAPPEKPAPDEPPADLTKTISVVSGDDPAKMTALAIESLGGMATFVKKDNVVVVKPNIAWERAPELAATTNPEVVATIVRECLKAGAKTVKVFDRTCNESRRCYRTSGIEAAAKEAGAEVLFIGERESFYKEMPFPKKKVTWPIVKEALECDVLINVPIAKHHGLSKLTLGIKNLMGLMGGKRGEIHKELGLYLSDLLTVVKPHLTIIDAYRVLVSHGPTGGKPEYVKMARKIIAGVDPVAVDAYATTLPEFGLTPYDIEHIFTASENKLGEIDLKKIKIIEKTI